MIRRNRREIEKEKESKEPPRKLRGNFQLSTLTLENTDLKSCLKYAKVRSSNYFLPKLPPWYNIDLKIIPPLFL